MLVLYLGQEDPLEEGMETHSSILAWRMPWTEDPGGPQSMGSQRAGHNRARRRMHGMSILVQSWCGGVMIGLHSVQLTTLTLDSLDWSFCV